MARVNTGRLVLGGLLAGVVINTFAFVAVYFVAPEAVAEASAEAAQLDVPPEPLVPAVDGPLLSGSEIAASNAWGFLLGFVAIALYAGLRTRRQPGPGTALLAGVAVWGLVTLLALVVPGMATSPLLAAFELAGILAGTLLGAWPYRDAPTTIRARSISPAT